MCVNVSVCFVCGYLWRPKESIRSLGTGVTGNLSKKDKLKRIKLGVVVQPLIPAPLEAEVGGSL